MRTCIACRQERSKRQLVRIVRTAEGVQVDSTGKLAGRGAYLCRARACWNQALQSDKLNTALRTTLNAEDVKVLREYAASLPESVVAESRTA